MSVATQKGLQEVAPNLWIYEEPLRFYGMQIGRKMIVIRLQSGELFINSPAELSGSLKEELDELGQLRYVTAASSMHGHLYMEHYAAAYSGVELFAVPGLPKKRKDLSFNGMLGSTPDPRWAKEIDQAVYMGNRFITEIEFFHRESKTLILGDICFNLQGDFPPFTSLMARLSGTYGKLGTTRDIRISTRNRSAARRSIGKISEWNFDRIIVGHGEMVEADAKAAFHKAFAWL